MQTEKAKALGTCPVCGRTFSADERLVFQNPQAVSKNTLVKPDQFAVEASQQRGQAEGTGEELTEDQERAPQWAQSGRRL